MAEFSDENESKKFLRLRRPRDYPNRESEQWPLRSLPMTDTSAMVRANVEQDVRAGRYKIKRARRHLGSRIWDFIVMCLIGDGSAVAFLQWAHPGRPTFIIVVSAMVFYTLIVGWVMFIHMDDY